MSRAMKLKRGSVRGCDPLKQLTNIPIPVSVFAAVDQGLSDHIATAIGHPAVAPLRVSPASEAIRFKPDIGYVHPRTDKILNDHVS